MATETLKAIYINKAGEPRVFIVCLRSDGLIPGDVQLEGVPYMFRGQLEHSKAAVYEEKQWQTPS